MVIPNTISREQAYLTSLASQPKGIAPDRIYEVRSPELFTKPRAHLSSPETRDRWEGCLRSSLPRSSSPDRSGRRAKDHQSRYRRRRCWRYTEGDRAPPAAHVGSCWRDRCDSQHYKILWKLDGGVEGVDNHGVCRRREHTDSGTLTRQRRGRRVDICIVEGATVEGAAYMPDCTRGTGSSGVPAQERSDPPGSQR